MSCWNRTHTIERSGGHSVEVLEIIFCGFESAQNRPIKTFPISASQVFPINSHVSGGPNEIYKATLQGTVTWLQVESAARLQADCWGNVGSKIYICMMLHYLIIYDILSIITLVAFLVGRFIEGPWRFQHISRFSSNTSSPRFQYLSQISPPSC